MLATVEVFKVEGSTVLAICVDFPMFQEYISPLHVVGRPHRPSPVSHKKARQARRESKGIMTHPLTLYTLFLKEIIKDDSQV